MDAVSSFQLAANILRLLEVQTATMWISIAGKMGAPPGLATGGAMPIGRGSDRPANGTAP